MTTAKMKYLVGIIIMTCSLMACNRTVGTPFVTVVDGHFERAGKPYYYVGTNFWYGAILGSEGQGGDRDRLCRELDAMKAVGIDNLRILVGSDGENGVTTKVEPTLQQAPGVYNDTILAGLDYLLSEMGKRQMVAVLYLNNSWEWSGGYGYYLEQAGCGKAPRPNEVGYEAFMQYASQYATNEKAHQLFYDYVRFIVSRTNRYTGQKYIDDPAIMAWQIGNEPRAFSKEALPAFEKWLSEASALIRSLDPNHLISIGSEGAWGCEMDYDCYQRICADKNIDYCNVHLWPYNWGWALRDSLAENLPRACENSKDYIDRHLAICEQLKKPLVMEEFGYPRDGMSFEPGSPTTGRDGYFRYIFQLVGDNMQQGGAFAGCNFWGWGGYAQPRHTQWQVGDDYCGDPAQEEQGLNSVFLEDISTLDVIRDCIMMLKTDKTISEQLLVRLKGLQKKGYMAGHQDDPFYGKGWAYEDGKSDVKLTVGDYPAVMGFELGGIEVCDAKNLDSVPFTRIHDELLAHVKRGGIVTVSWHPRNPITTKPHGGLDGQQWPEGSSWDVSDSTVVKNVLPGGQKAELFQTWMQRVGDVLESLKDDDGKLVPIIFRPWHENNGSWFWWGQKLCTDEEFKALWNLLQDYLDERGFDNLLWCYSPNLDGNWTLERFLQRYPGNNRVTLIGEDAYQWGSEEDYVRQVSADLDFLSTFAKKHGKLIALTECGYKNIPDNTWFSRVLKVQMDKYPISYFLLWRNAETEWFGPVPNTPCGNDYVKAFKEAENVMFLKDIIH